MIWALIFSHVLFCTLFLILNIASCAYLKDNYFLHLRVLHMLGSIGKHAMLCYVSMCLHRIVKCIQTLSQFTFSNSAHSNISNIQLCEKHH